MIISHPKKKYKPMSLRGRENIRLSHKGQIPWNKGKKLKPHSEETKLNMRISHLGKKYKSMSEIGRKNISLSHTGKPAWNKGRKLHKWKRTKPLSEDFKRRVAETRRIRINSGLIKIWNKGKKTGPLSSFTKEKIKISMMKKWSNMDWKEKEKRVKSLCSAHHIKPNKCEIFLDNVLQVNFPGEWKYAGNGKFWIEGKCPDFVNINGQKKLIELFGDYWHGQKRIGISKKQHEEERINHFRKYGFETLVVWEHEINDGSFINKLNEFTGKIS